LKGSPIALIGQDSVLTKITIAGTQNYVDISENERHWNRPLPLPANRSAARIVKEVLQEAKEVWLKSLAHSLYREYTREKRDLSHMENKI
jgi:hypothetical protein